MKRMRFGIRSRWSGASRWRRLSWLIAIGLTAWAVAPVARAPFKDILTQPYPDSVEYADAARHLANGDGYLTSVAEFSATPNLHAALAPPRYPFGFSAVLVPFTWLFPHFPRGAQEGTRAIAVAYVIALVWATWSLGGPLSAAVAALLVGLSPFARESASLVLSDTLAALLAVLALILLMRATRMRSACAGLLSGLLAAVRTAGLVAVFALFLSDRRRTTLALCLIPLTMLALYQWLTFGSPFTTGYDYRVTGLHIFGFKYALHAHSSSDGPYVFTDKLNGDLLRGVCPCPGNSPLIAMSNLAFYPAVLSGLFWVYYFPLFGVLGFWEMLRQRHTPAARYALVTVAFSFALLLPYFAQGVRFISSAASVLLVYAAVMSGRILSSAGARLTAFLASTDRAATSTP